MHILYSWDLSIVPPMDVNNETLVDIRYLSEHYVIATGSRNQMPNIVTLLSISEKFESIRTVLIPSQSQAILVETSMPWDMDPSRLKGAASVINFSSQSRYPLHYSLETAVATLTHILCGCGFQYLDWPPRWQSLSHLVLGCI